MAKPALVLVVDDVFEIAEMVAGELEAAGHKVHKALDGRQAVAWLAQYQPDLVLLDVDMPHMDGFGVLAYLRGNPEMRLTPVIMLTAHKQTEVKVRAMDEGADDFLSKPFDRDELLARVRAHLRVRSLTLDLDRERTRLTKLIEELRATQKKLLDAEKQQARAELMNQVAVTLGHQVNNPLTGLFGFAQELVDGHWDQHDGRPDAEALREVGENLQRGLKKIHEIVLRIQAIKDPRVVTYHGKTTMIDLPELGPEK